MLFAILFAFSWKREPRKKHFAGFTAGFGLLFVDMGTYLAFPGFIDATIYAGLHLLGCLSVGAFIWGVCERSGRPAPIAVLSVIALISTSMIFFAYADEAKDIAISLQHMSSGILFLVGVISFMNLSPIDWLERSLVGIFALLSASGLIRPTFVQLLEGRSYDGSISDYTWIVSATAMTPMVLTVALGVVLVVLTLKDTYQAQSTEDSADPISGFLDRPTFDRVTAEKFSACKRLYMPASLAVFEIDRLDEIRTKWGGGDVADTFLSTFSTVLRDVRRDSDIIGRVGENQYAVALVGMSPKDASRMAHKLRDKLAEVYRETAASQLKLALVCGIARLRESDSYDDCSVNAIASLNQAKQPQNSFIFIHGSNSDEPNLATAENTDFPSLN